MTDQEDNIYLGKVVFDDNKQEGKSWTCLGQPCSRSLIVSLSQQFVTLLIIFGCFWRIHLSKPEKNPPFGWEFWVVQQNTFYFHQDYGQNNFYKKSCLYIFCRSLWEGKVTTFFTIGSKMELFNQINTLRHFMMLCKKKLKISSLFEV